MPTSVFISAQPKISPLERSLKMATVRAIMKGLPSGLEDRKIRDGLQSKISIMYGPARAPYWTYDVDENRHIIIVPDTFNYNVQSDEIQVEIDKENMLTIFHEYGHALYTEVITEEMMQLLDSQDVPFDIVNIFEDMRIENLVSHFYLNQQTIWSFVKSNHPMRNTTILAEDDFFQVLIKLLGRQGDVEPEAFSNPYYYEINQYRNRVLLAENTSQVVDISIEFYNKYRHLLEERIPPKSKKKEKEEEKKAPSSQLKLSKSKMSSAQSFDELIGESFDAPSPNEETSESQASLADKLLKLLASTAGGEVLDDLLPITKEELKKLIKLSIEVSLSASEDMSEGALMEIETKTFPGSTKIVSNSQSSIKEETNSENLIDVKSSTIPKVSPSFFEESKDVFTALQDLVVPEKKIRPRNNGDEVCIDGIIGLGTLTDIEHPLFETMEYFMDKMASIHIVYDASGSMSGKPHENGLKILFAVNELARMGLLSAKITISKVLDNVAVYQTVEFPVAYEALFTIEADGESEGLSVATIGSSKEGAFQKDLILYFTDSNLSVEEHGKLSEIFAASEDIQNKAIGVYVGEKKNISMNIMTSLFKNKIIVEDNVVETALKIVNMLKNPTSGFFEEKVSTKRTR